MRYKKLLLASEASFYVIVTAIELLLTARFNPLYPLGEIFLTSIAPLAVSWLVIFLTFRIISHYHSQLENHLNQLKSLQEEYLKLSSNLKLDKLCSEAINTLTDFYQGKKGVLILTDKKLKKYASSEIFTVKKDNGKPIIGHNYRYKTFYPGKVSREFQEKVDAIIKEYHFKIYRSIIVLPFHRGANTQAIAVLGTNITDKSFLENIKGIIEIFVEHMVIFFENSLLHEQVNEASITDPLTNLYNRRFFQSRVKELFAAAKRKGFPISIMISDLDNFKYYVDTYGHPKGDIILEEIAKIARDALRESDFVCRFGGDEFAYLLPYASTLEAKNVAERLKDMVSSYKFLKEEKRPVHLTLSIGLASFPENGDNEEKILRMADQALFMAKEKGKDRIFVYQPSGGKNGLVN